MEGEETARLVSETLRDTLLKAVADPMATVKEFWKNNRCQYCDPRWYEFGWFAGSTTILLCFSHWKWDRSERSV